MLVWQSKDKSDVFGEENSMKKVTKIMISIMCVAVIVGACFALVACNNTSSVAKAINMVNVELSSEQYAFIFNKEKTELLNQVNGLLVEKADEIEAIKNKYLSATAEEMDTFLTEYKTAASNSENEFVVATNADFAPFEYGNGNKFAGIDIEIAALLANALNKTLVVVHMEFDAVVEAVETQSVYDIGMAALTVTEDRAEVVNFSNPYYDTTQVILTKNDVTVFDYCTTADEVKELLGTLSGANAKCGGQSGTTGQQFVYGNESLEFEGYSNLDFHAYDSPALAVQDMLNGNINFVIVDKAVAISLLKSFNA